MSQSLNIFMESLAGYAAKYVANGMSTEEAIQKGFIDMQEFTMEMASQSTKRAKQATSEMAEIVYNGIRNKN